MYFRRGRNIEMVAVFRFPGEIDKDRYCGHYNGRGAQTYCQLVFEEKEVNCRFFWLGNGRISGAEFDGDGNLKISAGDSQYIARKAAQ